MYFSLDALHQKENYCIQEYNEGKCQNQKTHIIPRPQQEEKCLLTKSRTSLSALTVSGEASPVTEAEI